MKMYTVYKHTNRTNKKVYIGITCQKPEYRWNGGRGYKDNIYFNRAIQKYSWDGFDHEILYENLEELQAKTLEISLIRFYDSTNPDRGYNISTGGDGCSGYKHSDEHRKKISDAKKGHDVTLEVRKKISESLKGHKCKPRSDEHRKKISDAKKGYKFSDESKKKMSESQHKQRVVCIETRIEYDSYKDAERKTGISNASIRQSCILGCACKGFHFKKLQ